jgi:hypothetical protein
MNAHLDFPATTRAPGPLPQRDPNWLEGDWWDAPPSAPNPSELPLWDWPYPNLH